MSTLTNFQIYDLVNRPRPLWLVKIDLSDAALYWVNLSECNLSMANLSKATLDGAELNMANLHRADLTLANLFEAHLNRANLTNATLTRANLTRADLGQSDLSWSVMVMVAEAPTARVVVPRPQVVLLQDWVKGLARIEQRGLRSLSG